MGKEGETILLSEILKSWGFNLRAMIDDGVKVWVRLTTGAGAFKRPMLDEGKQY